jgi:hypothetical protein
MKIGADIFDVLEKPFAEVICKSSVSPDSCRALTGLSMNGARMMLHPFVSRALICKGFLAC